MRTIFCLASGRSGTHYLYELVRRNTTGVICRHEPYIWNPSMFGRPIFDHATGNQGAVRKLVQRKRRIIESYRGATAYLETSHAFLKSWYDVACESFPSLKLVHLVRNPLQVARSEAIREELAHRWHLPLRNYRGGDGKVYFRWALTGLEPIFSEFQANKLSRFQWYLVQWIEIENRAMQFLDQFQKQDECYTLASPAGLNDGAQVARLLEFLELPRQRSTLVLEGRKNRTPGVKTDVTPQDRQEAQEVIAKLPVQFLQIFRHPPYTDWEWMEVLRP